VKPLIIVHECEVGSQKFAYGWALSWVAGRDPRKVFWPAMRAGDVLGVTSPIHLGDRGINGLGPANADRRMLHHGRLYNSYDEKRIA
jgi:hypothetical protein